MTRHCIGKHRRVVSGINLPTLLWSGGGAPTPWDFRICDRSLSGKDKNDHFREMPDVGHVRSFQPLHILFDNWYGSLENPVSSTGQALKRARSQEWVWLTQFRANRRVNPSGEGNVRLDTVEIPAEGRKVHLRGDGFGKVFRTNSPNEDVEHWATNDLALTTPEQAALKGQAEAIESYHRGLKQC